MMRLSRPPSLLLAILALAGCSPAAPPAPSEPAAGPPAVAPAKPPASPGERVWRVVFLGDSLTAGLGLEEDEAFPAVVTRLLSARGWRLEVINAGVSGDTTAGGVSRLDWVLSQGADLLVLELGGNDGLRGLAPETTEENLRQIITRARRRGVAVLLLGMRLPPNYGPEYVAAFEGLYPRLARELDVPYVPFFLDGVAGEATLNLPDGLHPNAQGQRIAAANLAPEVERQLVALRDGRKAAAG